MSHHGMALRVSDGGVVPKSSASSTSLVRNCGVSTHPNAFASITMCSWCRHRLSVIRQTVGGWPSTGFDARRGPASR